MGKDQACLSNAAWMSGSKVARMARTSMASRRATARIASTARAMMTSRGIIVRTFLSVVRACGALHGVSTSSPRRDGAGEPEAVEAIAGLRLVVGRGRLESAGGIIVASSPQHVFAPIERRGRGGMAPFARVAQDVEEPQWVRPEHP